MLNRLKNFKWQQWLALALFIIAVAATGFFAVKTVRRAVYWRNHRDETIRPWMSVRYVSRSYRVPPHVLYKAIGLPPLAHDRRPLREIAREQNRPVETLIAELQDAIVHARPPYPPPPPPSPDDGGPPP